MAKGTKVIKAQDIKALADKAEARLANVTAELERCLRLAAMLSDHHKRLQDGPQNAGVKACLEVSASVLKTLNGEVAAQSQAYQSAYEKACAATADALDSLEAG